MLEFLPPRRCQIDYLCHNWASATLLIPLSQRKSHIFLPPIGDDCHQDVPKPLAVGQTAKLHFFRWQIPLEVFVILHFRINVLDGVLGIMERDLG